MAGSDEQERIAYYQSRKQVGTYLQRLYSFFPGQPTVPNNETANKAIYINNGRGPGDKLLNGITPFVPEPLPCDEVILTDLSVVFVDPALTITIEWNLLPGDIITLFNTSTGQVLTPVAVSPIAGGLEVEFDMTVPPTTPGSWSLKVTRVENLDCFAVRNDIFQLLGALCLLTVTAMSSPKGFPVFPPGPAGSPGGTFTINVVGSGFLSGPLTILLTNGFFPFDTISPDSQLVIDDNNLTFDFTGNGFNGIYSVVVSLTSDPTCNGTPPFTIRLVAS